MLVCYEIGVKVGFGFGPCFIDYVLNFGISTRPELIIPIGMIFFAIYYIIFRNAIIRLNLPTIGREEENFSENEENISEFAKKIINGLGGLENLKEVSNCATRLRIIVNDAKKVDEEILKKSGVKGIFKKGNAIQIVIGTKVEFLADEINSQR